jgi:electron transfer flavoprotein alpha subunit
MLKKAEIIVLLECDDTQLCGVSLKGISLAREMGKAYSLLLIGDASIESNYSLVQQYGAEEVICVNQDGLASRSPVSHARIVSEIFRETQAQWVLSITSSYGYDILARASALLDIPMVSDVIEIENSDGQYLYRRLMNTGKVVSTLRVNSKKCALTARISSFANPETTEQESILTLYIPQQPIVEDSIEVISRTKAETDRPPLQEADCVVCGGRPIDNKEDFERLIGGLADVVGGAIGATRATVDAGVMSSEYQIGQTGVVVAPDLYIAAGVSGAIQHLAGIQDSKVIMAINKDDQAPIFDIADYKLVGDLYTVIPELIEGIKQHKNKNGS